MPTQDLSRPDTLRRHRRAARAATRPAAIGRIIAALALLSITPFVLTSSASATVAAPHQVSGCAAPRAAHEPSRQAPPGAHWLKGFTRTYCTDFSGSSLPRGWGKFQGVPQGDPTGYFDPSHVVVADGMLSLNTQHDPGLGGKWATGGVCQCGLGHTYGTFLVRSRITGPGDDDVQMLWPVAHVWPPEVDFNEGGGKATKTAWYVHFRSTNRQIAKTLNIDLMQWHTWGVRWTPHLMTFTVDGRIWGVVRSIVAIPHEAMTLDLSQQTWCGIAPECPTKPLSMQVDWVAEFTSR